MTVKIICAYCDSYIDADENTVCPNCGAPLEDAVREEEKKSEEREKAERELELEKEKIRIEAEEEGKYLALGLGAAAAALGATSKNGVVKKIIKKMI